MFELVGDVVIENGIMKKGVILWIHSGLRSSNIQIYT